MAVRAGVAIEEITREQALDMIDELAQENLHMSGKEFIEAWKAGRIEDPDRPEVMRVATLLPFLR